MEIYYLNKLPEPEEIQVVVLMGGLGTRLGDKTKKCPKALIEVNGIPFFDYELRILREYGFRKFLFLTGYKTKMIEEHYGDGSNYGVKISYSCDGIELLGTGGAIKRAYNMLEDDFLLLYGDSFMDIDFRETIYRYFRGKKQGNPALMTILENCGQWDRSNVVFKNGEIMLYDKKHTMEEMNYIDYGIGMYEKTLFEGFDSEAVFDIATIQHQLSLQKRLSAQEVIARFYEIGSLGGLEEFISYAIRRFQKGNPAVFFDRDGVINEIIYREETEQLDSPTKINELLIKNGVFEAMRKLQGEGYYLFIVTNQPAAAKGNAILKELYDINTYLCKLLKKEGIVVDAVEMCPHHPQGTNNTKEKFLIRKCKCRKPETGMLDNICARFAINIESSWMVGDSFTDVMAGRKAGLKTALLGNYKCDMCSYLNYRQPDLICGDIMDFVKSIIYRRGENGSVSKVHRGLS